MSEGVATVKKPREMLGCKVEKPSDQAGLSGSSGEYGDILKRLRDDLDYIRERNYHRGWD